MSKWLPEIMLDRAELAALSIQGATEPFTVAAAIVIADRLAEKDPLFSAAPKGETPSIARRFATSALERALDTAREDPAYSALLTIDLLIAGNQAQATTHALLLEQKTTLRQQTELLAKLTSNFDQIEKDRQVDRQALVALAQKITTDITDYHQAFNELNKLVDEFVIQRERAVHGTNLGELVERTFIAVANANAKQDFDGGARLLDQALQQLQEEIDGKKASQIGLLDAAITQHRLRSDVFAMAKAIIAKIELEYNSTVFLKLIEQAERYSDESITKGLAFEADVSIVLLEKSLEIANNDEERSEAQHRLGIVYSDKGERLRGSEARSLMRKARSAFETAARLRSQPGQEGALVTTQLSMICIIRHEALLCAEPEKTQLLDQAISIADASLPICRSLNMRKTYAAVLYNSSNVLITKAEVSSVEAEKHLGEAEQRIKGASMMWQQIGGRDQFAICQMALAQVYISRAKAIARGPVMLNLKREAISTAITAKTIFDELNMKGDASRARLVLSRALLAFSDDLADWARVQPLEDAIAYAGQALEIFKKHDFPAHWCQGQMAMGAAHLILAQAAPTDRKYHLLSAAHAFSAALEVLTPEHDGEEFARAKAGYDFARARLVELQNES